MVKNSKKSILGIVAFVITVGLALLNSNIWKGYIISNTRQFLSSYGWMIDVGNISGHLLTKTKFSNIYLTHSQYKSIYIESADINIGILESVFGLPTIELLFVKSFSFTFLNPMLDLKRNSALNNISISVPINIKSFYCSGNIGIISDNKDLNIKTNITGELVGGDKPKVYFDVFQLDLPRTPLKEMDFKALELSYTDSKLQLKNLKGTLLGLPILGSFSINNRDLLIQGKLEVNDFSIPQELLKKLPLKTKFSNFSGIFDFRSDFHSFYGELSLANNLGLNMKGEFNLEQLANKSWVLRKLLLEGENSRLLISGLLSQEGRLNSYLNLENLNFSRWIDNDQITTNLTGLAIIDGSLTQNGSLEQVDLTLEVLETEYFDVGETSFHGQLSYKDSIIATTSPVMLLIGNSQLTLDGLLNFSNDEMDIIADLENADIQLVNQFLPGNFNSGTATGRMKINGQYKAPSATAELNCNNIVYGKFFLESIEFNSKIYVDDGIRNGVVGLKVGKGNWKNNSFQSGTFDATIDNQKVIVENCHFKSGNDFFQFSGEYDGLDSYSVDRIQIAFEDNYLVNSGPIFFMLVDSSLQIDPFEFHINDGVLQGIVGGGSKPEGHIKMSNFEASVISPFISDERLNISGIVFGEILGRTTNSGFELDVDLSLKKGIYMKEPFDEMAVSFLLKDGMLHMDDFSMIRGKSMGLQISGIVPLNMENNNNIPLSLRSTFTNLPLSFVHNFFPDYFVIDGLATGSLQLGQEIKNDKNLENINITQFFYDMKITDAGFDLIYLGDVVGSGKYDGQHLYIDTLKSIRENEIIIASGLIPFDFNIGSKNFGGFMPNREFDFNAKGELRSLYFLSPYISDLDSVRAEIEIELSLGGSAESIQRNGKIIIHNGTASTLFINDDITHIEGQADIINNQLVIKDFNARTYHSDGNFEKETMNNTSVFGSIDFTQFFSPLYNLKVIARKASFKTLPIDIVGMGNVDVTITGRDTVIIEGTIEALDTKVFYEFSTTDVGESLPQELGTVMVYNLTIPIRGSAFFQNTQVDAKVSGLINLKQAGNEEMNFGGEIIVEDGNVFSYSDNFEGLQGYITFDNKGFNPIMNLISHTDIDNERINLRILGGMDNLDIILESGSGFSESDILELLTWGKRFEDAGMTSTGFGNRTVSILGSLLENQLEKNLKEMPGMMAMNLIDDIDISGTASLINPNQNENFEVTAKRKIGDKTYLNLSYMRSFSFTNNAQIGVEYKLNRHFSVVGNVDDLGKYSLKYRYRYAY